MNFKFSTNFLLLYVRKPAKYGVCGSTGLDATPTVQIYICHPVWSDIRSGFKTFWTLTPAFLAVFLLKYHYTNGWIEFFIPLDGAESGFS